MEAAGNHRHEPGVSRLAFDAAKCTYTHTGSKPLKEGGDIW